MVTKSDTALQKWTLDSWKTKEARQLPNYSNQEELESVLRTLDAFPPFMFAGEDRNLEERLADAAMGNAFSLQCGDCTERFKEFNANNIRNTFRSLLQMGVVLMFGGQMPVIKVGRMAGQSAKPRSEPLEEKNAVKLPSYRGDNINTDAFDEKSRTLNPQRLIRAYYQSAITLNLLRAFRHWRVYGHAKSHCWRERERERKSKSGVVPAQCTTRKKVEMERDINRVSLPLVMTP